MVETIFPMFEPQIVPKNSTRIYFFDFFIKNIFEVFGSHRRHWFGDEYYTLINSLEGKPVLRIYSIEKYNL
jgi:hypothetical protein